LLEKHDIDYATLVQQVKEQSDNYKSWILDCLDALPDYGLGGPENNEEFLEYMRWCLDNLSKIDDDYRGDVEKYVKFCIASIKKLKMKVHGFFEEKAYGKGIVDYLEFCKQYLSNYGGRAHKQDSVAYKNYMGFAIRHLQDFQLSEKSDSWGKEGYPPKFKSLIQKCLELLVNGGYHQAWSQYLEVCKALLAKFQMKNYTFLFDGELPPIISRWQEKLNEMFGRFTQKYQSKSGGSFGFGRWHNAEGTAAVNEAGQSQRNSASSNNESSANQGLVIGLMVMVGLTLLANIAIVAFLWKTRRASLDRM
jgi:hypothetical protein